MLLVYSCFFLSTLFSFLFLGQSRLSPRAFWGPLFEGLLLPQHFALRLAQRPYLQPCAKTEKAKESLNFGPCQYFPAQKEEEKEKEEEEKEEEEGEEDEEDDKKIEKETSY